jgi:GxxExxY protein
MNLPITIKKLATTLWEILGPGLSESVYQNALEVELRLQNISYQTETIVPILYKDHTIGNVRTDLIIENQLIIELKSIIKLTEESKIQIHLYSNILNLPGILINFPSKHGSLEIYQTSEFEKIV